MMKAYRVEKQIAANGELKLSALPFKEGDKVEVIILSHEIPTFAEKGALDRHEHNQPYRQSILSTVCC